MSTLFNLEAYYARLSTKTLGRPCVYIDKVETTIDVASQQESGTIVLAGQQTRGRGQRGNTWESPEGCAMASIRIECPKESALGKRLPFLQHILALSIAQTLEAIDPARLGREQVGLKWPNDVIYRNGYLKLAGVLVGTTDKQDRYDSILSFGLNVDNRQPTTCINSILAESGDEKVSAESTITIDRVVAEVMNNLEMLTDDLSDKKFEAIKSDYERRCLQLDKVVLDAVHGTIHVKAVNDDGYLVGEDSMTKALRTVTRII